MGDKQEEVDLRLEYISEYVLRSLKLKPDRWQKLMSSEDRHFIFRFLDQPKYELIVFFLNLGGLLTMSLTFPPTVKAKVIYFLKNISEPITAKNYMTAWTIGEMSNNVLIELGVMADEVFGPMLTNPANQKGWPKCVVEDMKKHVAAFRNMLYELRGKMTSQVMLPMPDGIDRIYSVVSMHKDTGGEETDLEMKSNAESAVLKWANLVNELIKEDSLIAFKRTKFPLPGADFEFYSSRLRNLEGVYSQLCDPRVKKMAHFLEDTDSVYLDCFKNILTNVISAISATRDIVAHQKPLIFRFEEFEQTDFADAQPLIRPMMHCVAMLWGNSRHYCSADKLIPFLREICNLFIQQCTNSIDPPTIFTGEPEDQIIKLRHAIKILEHFVETYAMNRDNIDTFFPPGVPPVRWGFAFDRVFARFNVYMKRLRMTEEILAATCEYLKLEKVEFGGLRGKILSNDTIKLMDTYNLAYGNLGNISYDPADPEDDSFLQDYENHKKVIEDMDRRLGCIFSQALDECYNLEQFYKLFQILGDLFHRPIINKELQPKLPKLIDFMNENLDDVKEIFDEELEEMRPNERPMIDNYLPPVAGVMWWLHKLRQRISGPMEDFVIFEDPLVNSESAEYMKEKHNEMLSYLNQLDDKGFQAWCVTVPDICLTNLAKPLIVRDPPCVRLNFDPELEMLLREMRYMSYLNKEGIPQEGLDLYARNEDLMLDIIRLNRTILWYNEIRQGSHPSEVALIENEIAAIDELLGRGADELDWNSDFSPWITQCYEAIDNLQKRVLTAKDNVKRGLEHMAAWGNKPLYERKYHPVKLKSLALDENPERLATRKENIMQNWEEFIDILDENYRLFFNIVDEEDIIVKKKKSYKK